MTDRGQLPPRPGNGRRSGYPRRGRVGEAGSWTRSSPYDEVAEVLAHGDTKSSVVLRSGIQVDLRVVEEKSFGAALHVFHRQQGPQHRHSENAGSSGAEDQRVWRFQGRDVGGRQNGGGCVCRRLDLPFIPPELREDAGEIEAAREGKLPKLVESRETCAAISTCTPIASDGKNTLREMADAAAQALATSTSPSRTTPSGCDGRRPGREAPDETDGGDRPAQRAN